MDPDNAGLLGERGLLAVESGRPKEAEPLSPWTVDDVVLGEWGSQFKISPDGRHVAWVKHAPDKDKNAKVNQLMLSSLTDTREVAAWLGQREQAASIAGLYGK